MPIVERKLEKDTNRITGLDLYRIIACLMVFINHNSSKVMVQVPDKSMAWYVTVAVIYITKIAVPGFFMISGYNLLHREDSWEKTWKRISRILVDLVAFSLIYYIWKCAVGTIVINSDKGFLGAVWAYIWGFISIVWTSPMTEAYWYLYTYLGVLLILPFLQKMATNMSFKDLNILIALSLVFVCILPTIYVFVPGITIAADFTVPLISASYGTVMYMFIGHGFYMQRDKANIAMNGVGKEMKKAPSVVLFAGLIIGFILSMVLTMVEYNMTGGERFTTMSRIEYLPLAMESICLFALIIRIRFADMVTRTISLLAPCTFGVYLITDFVCTNTHFVYFYLCPHMNRLVAVAIQDAVAIVIAFAVIYAVRLIPLVKKWI